MNEHHIDRDGVRITFQVLGRQDAPAVVLLAGNGCGSSYWPDVFCEPLLQAGLRVIRFDYRDTGASTHRDFEAHPYDLDDIGGDVLALLDTLGVERAHLVGLSMGGFIAQRLAIQEPKRVASLTTLLSTPDYGVMLHTFSGGPAPTSSLPPPSAQWLAALGSLPSTLTPEEFMSENWRLANGARAPFDAAYWRELGEAAAARGNDIQTGDTHRKASLRTPRKDLLEALRQVSVPALFIGGSEDPIFPPGHAEAAARAVPGGKALMIDGMGHALNPAFFGVLASAIVANTQAR
ncbi:alpha/beta fold hydrolase [Corallococcus carmarthensis]|uniref:Alpha/beta hydrolase n=1 Tax=Corallococcus carmarthensis TaxID=2316728 RepID=A0A3A8K8R6_9BACT|nr:alpha/beta hydrolase [Corallococcus carmarthensis]RKG98183.1 alpha/beta hydrolase [Corallococcus carmarthensis]